MQFPFQVFIQTLSNVKCKVTNYLKNLSLMYKGADYGTLIVFVILILYLSKRNVFCGQLQELFISKTQIFYCLKNAYFCGDASESDTFCSFFNFFFYLLTYLTFVNTKLLFSFSADTIHKVLYVDTCR